MTPLPGTFTRDVSLRVGVALLVVAATLTLPLRAAPAPISVPLADGSGARLRIDSRQGSARLLSASGETELRVNATLRDALSRSDTVLAIGQHRLTAEPDSSVLLFVSAPSHPTAAMGYCGAGQEDGLLLLAVRNGALVMHDFVLLQSCLHSIEQAVDLGAEPAAAFHPVPSPWLVSFAAMHDDKRVQRCVGIRDERLTFQDDCITAPDASP
jgi:hypothetical protein